MPAMRYSSDIFLKNYSHVLSLNTSFNPVQEGARKNSKVNGILVLDH